MRLATWNTWGVPTAPHGSLRLRQQVDALRDRIARLDVVLLQEVFQHRARLAFARMFRSCGWHVMTPVPDRSRLLPSGLLIATRAPPLAFQHVVFGDCRGVDCLAGKGAAAVVLPAAEEVEEDSARWIVATAHMQDDVWDEAGHVRAAQIDELERLLLRPLRARYPAARVVCAGDFNIDPGADVQLFRRLQTTLGLRATASLWLDGTHQPTGRHVDHMLLGGGDDDDVARAAMEIEWVCGTRRRSRWWCDRRGRMPLPLSDHHLVRVRLPSSSRRRDGRPGSVPRARGVGYGRVARQQQDRPDGRHADAGPLAHGGAVSEKQDADDGDADQGEALPQAVADGNRGEAQRLPVDAANHGVAQNAQNEEPETLPLLGPRR